MVKAGEEQYAMMTLEKLLDGLLVRVEPFALCRTTGGSVLESPALEFATLHYVVAGRGSLTLSGLSPIALESGTMVILPPRIPGKLTGGDGQSRDLEVAKNCLPLALGMQEMGSGDGAGGIVVACSSISASYQQLLGLFDYLPEPIVSSPGEAETIGRILETLLGEMADPKPGSASLVALLMKQCFVHVLRRHCASGHCQVPWLAALEDRRLAHTLEQMLDDPGRRFTLELLADEAGMSRSAFAEHFKGAFGRSPMDFLKELRMQRAAQLLQTTTRPIKSIADLVGFESRSHFSRSFSDFFGASPAEFRNTGPSA